MTVFVEFTTTDGVSVWLNPKHVKAVLSEPDNANACRIVTAGDSWALTVEGNANEAIDALEC